MAKSNDKSTQLSEDRTLLSNERTFSSWMGVGLACVGVALGLQAVFGKLDETWLVKGVATIFLITAIVLYWAAVRQACKTHARLHQSEAETQPPSMFKRIASLMTLGTVGVGVVL